MRFVLDQSADRRLAGFLRSLGHDVTVVAVDYPHSLPDERVLEIAVRERRILIADDSDFGELIFRHRLAHCGVMYFRLPPITLEAKIERLIAVLHDHAHELDEFLVVTEHRVRVRRK